MKIRKTGRWRRMSALLLIFCMLCTVLPASAEDASSDYDIILGPYGLGSDYDALDETAHILGDYTAGRTYILRFQDESFTVTNGTGGAIFATTGKLVNAAGEAVSYGSFLPNSTHDTTYLIDPLGLRLTDPAALTVLGYTELDPAATAFYYVFFVGNTSIDLGYALLIEITPNGAVSAAGTARLALGEQIDRVTGEHTDDWYQSGDRYNGRTVSEKGFWSEMQAVLAAAQGLYADPDATAAQLTAATEDLAAAIGALIPADRVNATELYEAVQHYSRYNEVNYTAETWAPFAAALADAQALLASLYELDGRCTAINEASYQPTADAAVQALDEAFDGLMDNSALESFNFFALLYRRTAEWLLSHTELDEAEYTAESWIAWVQARDEMAACVEDGCGTTVKIRAYLQAISNASTAYYALESNAESVSVHVRVADTFSLIYPGYGLADDATVTYDGDVTLTGDKTVGALMDAMAFDKTQIALSATYAPGYFVYINGELAVDRSRTSVGEWQGKTSGAPQLHDGDDVVIAVVDPPAYYYYVNYVPNAGYDTYYGYLALLHIEDADRVIETEAGTAFEVSVSRTTAAAEIETATAAAGGIDIFLSPAQADEAGAKAAPATEKLDIQTSVDGTASVTVYTEGWYRLAVADVTRQKAGSVDVYGNSNGGEYDCLAAGDYVLLHVVPSSDSGAVRAALQAELDGVYATYAEDFYTPAQWAELTEIYTEATDIIANSALLGDAFSAQKAALSQMRPLIDSVVSEHQRQMQDIAWFLERLPDDADDFTENYKVRFEYLKDLIDGLSPYMLDHLTLGQRTKYDMLLQAYNACNGDLPAGRTYSVSFVVSGERESLYVITDNSDPQYRAQALTADTMLYDSLQIDAIPITPGSSFSFRICDSAVTDQYDWPEIQVTDITVDGVSKWTCNVFDGFQASYSAGDYRYSRHNAGFIMPDNDVTVYITVGSVGDAGGEPSFELEAVRQDALQRLWDLFETYDEEQYALAVWNTIVSAKENGEAAINSAATEDAILSALRSATTAMLAAGQDMAYAISEGIELPNYGDVVGRVFISLENTTYPDGNIPFEDCYAFADENLFFAGWYDLCENDTMMTAMLKALALNGLSWLGTGGSGYTITYLSTVYVDVNGDGALDDDEEPKLAEFNGGNEAGWMGTLNDWFVNYGMDQFSYAGGGLHTGDVISIKYTSSGLGTDLGGSFGDPDTSLKALEIDGGTLDPAFDSATRTYTLIVPGGSGNIKVTPTASNKNYLVKAFLNEYDSDDAYYPRTQMIPVRSGDVLYVGCGERNWPSMNNQEGEAISYTGTKYTVYIVGSTADSVDKKAELLPEVGTLTYANYTHYSGQITELYGDYAELSENEKAGMTCADKLEALYEKVLAFAHIDEVKALLAGLPAQSAWTDADAPALQAALDAYNTLSDPEKLAYMTVSEGAIVTAIEEFLTPAAILEIKALIAALPPVSEWTEADKPALQAVLDAYNTLSDSEKLDYITVAEKAIITEIEEFLASSATILYGDANGDGQVDTRDATRIMRYLAGRENQINLEAADANGDGFVDTRDATRIMRYLAGRDTLGR